jgi:SAM-dependent methyltransferase
MNKLATHSDDTVAEVLTTPDAVPRRDEALYKSLLHLHLANDPDKEIDFFVNARRFDLMTRLIGNRLTAPNISILNSACGPFALEFYLNLTQAELTSFDRDSRLKPLHSDLTKRGLITPCSFDVVDVADFKSSSVYDVVLVNDLFYTKHVDFYQLIGTFAAAVKPGGTLYFDIQDERAGVIWKAARKDSEFRRYALADVRAALEHNGLEVESMTPALGIKGGLDRVIRKGLWQVAGIANNFAFVARKRGL